VLPVERGRPGLRIVRAALTAILLMTACAGSAASAGRKPVKREVPWDMAALSKAPKVHPTDVRPAKGMRSFFYEGAMYKGKPTWVFAYFATPKGKPPRGGWPAVVCAHGGGGTAYPGWVRKWNSHGYAAIAMDLEGHLPRLGRPRVDPRTRIVQTKYAASRDFTEAWVYYTTGGGRLKDRKWEFIRCKIGKRELVGWSSARSRGYRSVEPCSCGTTRKHRTTSDYCNSRVHCSGSAECSESAFEIVSKAAGGQRSNPNP